MSANPRFGDLRATRSVLDEARAVGLELQRRGTAYWSLCPFHVERTPSFKIDDERGAFYCFGCGARGDVIDFVAKLRGISLGEAVRVLDRDGVHRLDGHDSVEHVTRREHLQRDAEAKRIEGIGHAKEIWDATVSAHDVAEIGAYLTYRGLNVEALGGVPRILRLNRALRYFGSDWPNGKPRPCLPAMVAAVQDVKGNFLGTHCTFLEPGGRGKSKAVPEGKEKLFRGPVKGGAVRLAEANDSVVLTEGIETALAVLQSTGQPTWATLSTSGLVAVNLPDSVEKVTIAADHDDPGIQAADIAARRFQEEGHSVRIVYPPNGHKDFLDALVADDASIAVGGAA